MTIDAASETGFNYFASGTVEHVFLGPNSIIQQFCQNNRLQTTGIRVGAPGGTTSVNCANTSSADRLNLTLGYPQPPANNGNVLSQAIRTSAPFSATQAYTYDAYNRIGTATETGGVNEWNEVFGYDQYGNRWERMPVRLRCTADTRPSNSSRPATFRPWGRIRRGMTVPHLRRVFSHGQDGNPQ